jgi:antitoxin CptB
MSVEASRLRWRCRRGMRELDQLLGWYLDARYPFAAEMDKAAFSTLLEQPDPDLWAWLSGQSRPERPEWRSLIDEIRTRDRI